RDDAEIARLAHLRCGNSRKKAAIYSRVVTRRLRWVCGLLILAVCSIDVSAQPAATEADTGVVVERVGKDGPGAASGLRSGDRLVSWTACPSKDGMERRGVFASTFDFMTVQREEASRCAVMIEGRRGRMAIAFN